MVSEESRILVLKTRMVYPDTSCNPARAAYSASPHMEDVIAEGASLSAISKSTTAKGQRVRAIEILIGIVVSWRRGGQRISKQSQALVLSTHPRELYYQQHLAHSGGWASPVARSLRCLQISCLLQATLEVCSLRHLH